MINKFTTNTFFALLSIFFYSFSTQLSAQCPPVTRTVSNAKSDTPNDAIGVILKDFISSGGAGWLFEQGATFTENADGSADLQGILVQYPLPSNFKFDLNVHFINRTTTAPAGSPVLLNTTPNIQNWVYFDWGTATMKGMGELEGALVNLTKRGKAAQIGIGGNDQLPDVNKLGMSAWFNWEIVSQPVNEEIILLPFPANPSIDQGDIAITMSGEPCVPPSACIKGQTFCDLDGNGMKDEEDVLLSNIAVTLVNDNQQVIATVNVDADGNYQFCSLAAGTYYVKFPTTTIDGKPLILTSASPLKVVISNGQVSLNNDGGYQKPKPKGSISGSTFCDNNNNGIFDNGDVIASNLTITLCDANFVTLATKTVDANGAYSFGDLVAGTYNIKFPTATLDGKPLTSASPVKVVLTEGGNVVDINGGYFKPIPKGSISGFTYCDNNNNGIFDNGDVKASNLTITLCDANFVTLATKAVDANGAYSFGDLVAGTYNIKFPTATLDGKPLTSASPVKVVLTEGGNVVNINGAYFKPCTPAITFVNKTNCPIDLFIKSGTTKTWLKSIACNASYTVNAKDGQIYHYCNADGSIVGDYKVVGCSAQTVNITRPVPPAPVCNANFSATQCYKIVNKRSGKSLDVYGCKTANNTPIVQWGYNGGAHQQWRFVPTTNGYVKIVSRNGGRVLANHATTQGSNSYLYDYYSGGYKDWKIECAQNGLFRIVHRASGKVLDVANDALTDGANIQIKTWDGTNSQLWEIVAVNCASTGAYLTNSDITTVDARAELNRSRIEWVNNTGFKNDYFEVEKMNMQSGKFEMMSMINNASETDAVEHYIAYDNSPLEGENIYRLKTTFQDGTVQFSENKTVVYKGMLEVRVFPNPTTDVVRVDLSKYSDKEVTLYLYNNMGQMVKKQTVENPTAMPAEMDVTPFDGGNYMLRIESQGKREVAKTLIINK
jgi:hypothetical protein